MKHTKLLILLFLWVFVAGCTLKSELEEKSFEPEEVFKEAQLLSDQQKYDEAIQLVDSVYATSQNVSKKDQIKKWSFISHVLYFNKKNYFETLKRVDSLLAFTEIHSDLFGEEYADALYYKGNILIAHNEYIQGTYYYQKALEFARMHLDICHKSYFHGNLANLLLSQGKYKQAIQHFQNHFNQNANCNPNSLRNYFSARQGALNSIGYAYEKLGMLDSAAASYLRTIDFIDTVGIQFKRDSAYVQVAKAVVLGNLGGVYLRQQKYDEALEALSSSIQNNQKYPKYAHDVCLTRMKLAHLYIKLFMWNEANSEIRQVESCLPTLTEDEHLGRYFNLKWEYASAQRDTSEAYEYHLQLKEISDRIHARKTDDLQIDYQQVFMNLRQADELDALRAANRQKTIYIFLFTVVVLLTGIILFLVRRNQIQERKNVIQLSDYNQVILNKTSQLQKTLHDLQESQQENTQMMKIVAHDLRNPISAILQITQMIQMDKSIPGDQMTLINMIQNSAGASLEFINDLLHFNSSFEQLKKEDIEISAVLLNSIELLNFKAAEKNQHIHVETEVAFCMANREKLWRVFNNLISNAIKFSPENSVIQISLHKSDTRAICMIKDQGIGIPEEIKHQVFDLFTDAKRSGTSGEQSFGLGLAISKQIIKAHQGKIWFESSENEGTIFFVELPLYII